MTPPTAGAALLGRNFVLLLTATVLTCTNFAPLLSVLPLWSAQAGADTSGLGSITGTMMAATVGVQTLMPWILRRFGLRLVFAVGALLLGLPTLAYSVSADLSWVLAVSVVRGAGFGMVVVSGSALVATLVTPARRGTAVGLYGMAVGIPHVLALPLGVWYAQHAGFHAVFVATGVLCAAAVPLLALMTSPVGIQHTYHPETDTQVDAPEVPSWPVRVLATPWIVMLACASATGGVTSFLALAQPELAPAALFLLYLGVVAGRWGGGVLTDRTAPGRLTLPGLTVACLGMGGLALAAGSEAHASVGVAVLTLAAATLYGTGFGVVQNDTLVVMFHRAGPAGTGSASTVWNLGYDAGVGAGALVVGMVASGLGISGAFAVSALAMGLITPLVWRDGRRDPPPRPPRQCSTHGPARPCPAR
ncbi:MFS transporter [Lipingzhangella sp. LS1_29]|uniref:MFS transporter n=1 Tax=Lipingzhangella rawalii TaxID=2055835 RepID=A0ABU2H123_9ACTN|nr:MFS transporter [Lipingzhangella rawalii]MDS1269005.1 MFS transporter [Lipingzhangella rawalii]